MKQLVRSGNSSRLDTNQRWEFELWFGKTRMSETDKFVPYLNGPIVTACGIMRVLVQTVYFRDSSYVLLVTRMDAQNIQVDGI